MKTQTIKYKLQTKQGFTLLETLIALSIFSITIVSLIVFISDGVANAKFTKNKLTAYYLAQEGIELIRNVRDTNIITGGTWNDFAGSGGIVDVCKEDGCLMDYTLSSPQPCTGNCPGLKYDNSSSGLGFYDYSLTFASPFTRTILVEPVNSSFDHEIRITSKVSWVQGRDPKEVIVSENLFDWISISL